MRQSHCVSVRFSGSELRTHDHYPPTTPFVRWGVFGKPPPCCGLQDPRLTPIPYTIRLFLLIRYSLTHQCLPYPQSTNKQANVAPNECPVRPTSKSMCLPPIHSSHYDLSLSESRLSKNDMGTYLLLLFFATAKGLIVRTAGKICYIGPT